MGVLKQRALLFSGAATSVAVIALLIPLLYPFKNTLDAKFAAAPTDNFTFIDQVCSDIYQSLPYGVFPPRHPVFEKSRLTYFARQESALEPSCIVKPRDTNDVSLAIKAIKHQFDLQIAQGLPVGQFAVRSGGHSFGAGFSSVAGGVVLDLHYINEITVSDARDSIILGTGARWQDVYGKLDAMGLGVAGGRASDVGVGGFLTGGGISFLSPRVGFASGNVLSYEIILANGTVATASATENPKLWRALQGGSNNFGVVTRFKLRSWNLGKLWGGYNFYSIGKAQQLLNAFHEFAKPENFDPDAAGPIVGFGYLKKLGFPIFAGAVNLIHTKPEKWPPYFNRFNAIGRLWSLTKVRSMLDATREINSLCKRSMRRYQAVTTFKNDNFTLKKAYEAYLETLDLVRQGVSGIEWAVSFQPVPSFISTDGPDPFGLSLLENSLVILLISPRWDDEKDDKLVEKTADYFISSVEKIARSRGVAHPFKYLNYAAKGQPVFDGYGSANKKFLQETSKAVDPQGLFQRACQGGFKLDIEYPT